MSGARRLLLVVALAAIAVVPLRAFGVVGGESASGLGVDASLGGCGVSSTQIVCQIQVAFDGIEGADHYTATVTRADGSVQSAGTVGTGEDGGSATLYVPYVGAGTYSVTVSAWGEDEEGDGDSEPELLERDRSGADKDRDRGKVSAEPVDPEAPGEMEEVVPEGDAPPAETVPAPPETQTLPECQPEDTADAAPDQAADGADVEASAATGEASPAPPVECTTPSSDSNGPCCPPGA